MKSLFNYGCLFLYSMLSFAFLPVYTETIVGLLVVLLIICLAVISENKILTAVSLVLYLAGAVFYPYILPFSVLLFPLIHHFRYRGVIPCYVIICYMQFFEVNRWYFAFLLFGAFLGMYFNYQTEKLLEQHMKYIKMKDEDTELNLLLNRQNQTLQENQDYEINNAMLQERNRISREIHDNVGHMLSRCILITGALKAINKDENCKESIELLNEGLSSAMNSIRNSVHNLHEASLNLKYSMQETIRDYTFCNVTLNYDMGDKVPANVSYAFLSIFKEALTNTAKHSNATQITATVIEHPAMYQLIIADNGKKALEQKYNLKEADLLGGIGLSNMYDRIKKLNGFMEVSSKDGFNIFISVPKIKTL